MEKDDEGYVKDVLLKDSKKWNNEEVFAVVSMYFHALHREIVESGISDGRVTYFAEGVYRFFKEKSDIRIRTVLTSMFDRKEEHRAYIDHLKGEK